MGEKLNSMPKYENKAGATQVSDQETSTGNGLENKEKQPTQWDKMKAKFSEYIVDLVLGYGKLEKATALSFLERYKAGMQENRESTKMQASDDRIYKAGIELARKMGWQEKRSPVQNHATNFKQSETEIPGEARQSDTTVVSSEIPYEPETGIPVFITRDLEMKLLDLGVAQEEIDKLTPSKAWQLLQEKKTQKKAEDKLSNNQEKPEVKVEKLDADFDVLQKIWDEAYDRMYETSKPAKLNEILKITAIPPDAHHILVEYLEKSNDLTPEEKYFIQISIHLKTFKSKANELIFEGAIEDKNAENEIITDSIFEEEFIDKGQVSDEILNFIAEYMYRNVKFPGPKSVAIFSDRDHGYGNKIETILRERKKREESMSN